VASVTVYLDSDGDGVLNPETDRLIGSTPSGRPSAPVNVPGAFLVPGENRIFAKCRDNDGAESSVVWTITFSASGVVDSDGSIRAVDFWIDANNNGVLDKADRKLGSGKLAAGVWQLNLKPRTLAIGQYRVLAIATDNAGETASFFAPDQLVVVA